jgi:YVTN family beta-propeller protein
MHFIQPLAAMLSPKRKAMRMLLFASIAGAASLVIAAPAAQALRTVGDVPLDVLTRRLGAQSLDRITGVLFIADSDGGRVIAFDTKRNRVITVIANLPSAQSVLAVPSEHRVYVSEPNSFEVAVIDSRSYTVTTRIAAGRYPNALAWGSAQRKLYVSDEIGETETVIDGAGRRVNAIPLGGEAGASQYDAVENLVYVNVKTRAELIAIDPRQDAIVARYPLAGCVENGGLLVDAAGRTAYVACHGNARLLAFDLRTHRVRETQAVPVWPSALTLDGAAGALYVLSDGGHLALFDVRRGQLRMTAEDAVSNDAFGVSPNPANHRIYFALHDVTGKAVVRIITPVFPRAAPARSRLRSRSIRRALPAQVVREKSALLMPPRWPARSALRLRRA